METFYKMVNLVSHITDRTLVLITTNSQTPIIGFHFKSNDPRLLLTVIEKELEENTILRNLADHLLNKTNSTRTESEIEIATRKFSTELKKSQKINFFKFTAITHGNLIELDLFDETIAAFATSNNMDIHIENVYLS